MQLELTREGNTLTAHLTGELDHHSAADLRRQIIAREFSHLNPRQQEGVLATEGPLLLLAGPPFCSLTPLQDTAREAFASPGGMQLSSPRAVLPLCPRHKVSSFSKGP